jgi:hypothetical protein
MDTRINQDVRDTIAEFAIPTVAEWLGLRAASRAWRLAVDDRARSVVTMGQPKLCPWRGDTFEAGAPLAMDADEESLDDIRLHWTCDRFRRITRAVIVAFALDGAKDELSEAGWCGPRPLLLSSNVSGSLDLRDDCAMSAVINANLVADVNVSERNVAELPHQTAHGNHGAVVISVTDDTDTVWELVSGIAGATTTTLSLHFLGEVTPRWASGPARR